MIVKPQIVERRTAHDVTDDAARRVLAAGRIGAAAGVKAARLARAAYLAFLALMSAFWALSVGLSSGSLPNLIGAGGVALALGWFARRQFRAALAGR